MTAAGKRYSINTTMGVVLGASAESEQKRLLWDLSIVGTDKAQELLAAGASEEEAPSLLDLTVLKEALAEVASCMEFWLLEGLCTKHATVRDTHDESQNFPLWTLPLDFILQDTDSDGTAGSDTLDSFAS